MTAPDTPAGDLDEAERRARGHARYTPTHCHLREAAWEGRLRRSEVLRRAQRSEAERIVRNAVWSAA